MKCHSHLKYLSSGLIIIALIAGCATSKKPAGKSSKSTGRSPLPKTPRFALPGGNSENWRYLGTTDDNQIADEIDYTSIESVIINTYKYQDRKTIISPNTFTYASGQPQYKFAIGSWMINCVKEQYLLTQTTIYDTYGNLIKQYDYTNDNDVKWLKFGHGSIAYMQYNFICLNQNKNLGY